MNKNVLTVILIVSLFFAVTTTISTIQKLNFIKNSQKVLVQQNDAIYKKLSPTPDSVESKPSTVTETKPVVKAPVKTTPKVETPKEVVTPAQPTAPMITVTEDLVNGYVPDTRPRPTSPTKYK
jgi:hypothetical protein